MSMSLAVIMVLSLVTLLLGQGVDINLTGGKYGTALGVAAYRGKQEIAKFFLDRGANPDLTNYEGLRPRDLAEQEGNQHISDLLDSKCVYMYAGCDVHGMYYGLERDF
ncbi:hypothetical protein L211DRAFT_840223 [Terfezia boudieri ATCC MYA-4762]|uniref:Uncharacterized protein n=1 Tax=Terfezia boudieri ATCC MYA-4762 TaxID=1051890 RepID=A0A3N4LJI6_9PEZI|nr:hypothetical protein L211DRAFT_840223 [Terfezia boudieri ATCC MYA-4762]